MKNHSSNHRRTIRNLTIFAFVAISAGWVGRLWGEPGQLLWLVAPLLSALLLRSFGGDGWNDFGLRLELKKSALWYAVSLVLFPLCAALIIFTGCVLGLVTLPDVSPTRAALFLHLTLLALAPSFFKNIFEEFAWRGYLAPRISSLGVHDLVGHVLVGLVWAAWHIPYYLFFLDRASFEAFTSKGFGIFFSMMFAGVAALSLVYGEIRLLSKSVWPVLLLHTVSNAVGNPLLLHGFIRVVPGADVFVSPGPGSVCSIIVYSLIGIGLYRFRKRKAVLKNL